PRPDAARAYRALAAPAAASDPCTLSLHDALPISLAPAGAADLISLGGHHGVGERGDHLSQQIRRRALQVLLQQPLDVDTVRCGQDRKSTRLNSSHVKISYAVFCLKKKIDQMYPGR